MKNKVQVTVVFEYEMDSENYPPELRTPESRMETDKDSMESQGFTFEEMGFEVQSSDWKVLQQTGRGALPPERVRL